MSRSLSICAALAMTFLLGACAWSAWIPGESSWNPDVVVDPSQLAELLPLGTVRVGEVNCFTHRCLKRYRVVVEEPGQLTVRLVPELSGPDAQARLVLESIQGVLAQASTGRGESVEDVTVLSVRETVNPGSYFVLIQSLGGPMPYEVSAYLEPGPGPDALPSEEPEEPAAHAEHAPPSGPEPRLVEVELPGRATASYDPAVSFVDIRTFAFTPRAAAGGSAPAGTVIEQPIDRQIRRFLAEDLELKGFRPASDEPADLQVEFARSDATRFYRRTPFLWYDLMGPPGMRYDEQAREASRLTVDIIDTRSQRIAWHGTSDQSMGPGVVADDNFAALAREAVSDILARFPPN